MGDLFDLSHLTYDEFVNFFFEHDMVTEEKWYHDPELFDFDNFIGEGASSPQTVVEHMTHLFTQFDHEVSKFSPGQVNAGIWAMFSIDPFHLQRYLWLPSIPLTQRLACIRSMYNVYADHVAKSRAHVMENCFDMWWDLVAGGFWQDLPNIKPGDIKALNEEQNTLLDTMFETLSKILALPDERTQGYALHGLGHLHHPGVRQIVQRYLDSRRHELEADGIKWVEKCRDGTVM